MLFWKAGLSVFQQGLKGVRLLFFRANFCSALKTARNSKIGQKAISSYKYSRSAKQNQSARIDDSYDLANGKFSLGRTLPKRRLC